MPPQIKYKQAPTSPGIPRKPNSPTNLAANVPPSKRLRAPFSTPLNSYIAQQFDKQSTFRPVNPKLLKSQTYAHRFTQANHSLLPALKPDKHRDISTTDELHTWNKVIHRSQSAVRKPLTVKIACKNNKRCQSNQQKQRQIFHPKQQTKTTEQHNPQQQSYDISTATHQEWCKNTKAK